MPPFLPATLLALALPALLAPGPAAAQEAPAPVSAREAAPRPAEAAGPGSFSELVKAKAPAVVGIIAEQEVPGGAAGGPQLPPDLYDFFGGPEGFPAPGSEAREALGSGFLISPDGLVVTNNHVVEAAAAVRVALEDGRTLDAEIVGVDPATDLALLRVEGENLPALDWGDSDAVEVGDWVVAIGNPFGLGGTVTAGILSARSRDINVGPYDDFLQTDASINRGNSGGPLFDEGGRVIGVNTAIFSPTGGNVGIGFATPSNVAQKVVDQLRETGTVTRGWLGVTLQPLDAALREALGLSVEEGALVAEVTAGSPAAAAGVEAGDVIVGLAGEPIEDARALSRGVAELAPGRTADLTVLRAGGRRTLEVEIGVRPQDLAAGPESEAPATNEAPLGVAVAPLDAALRQRLGAPEDLAGLYVSEVTAGSPAAEAGLRPGDVIAAAGGAPVADVEALRERVAAAREAGRSLLLRYWREGSFAFAAAPVAAG